LKNRVLRKIFRPERYEITGGWRKLHNEELQILYSSPNIIGVIRSRKIHWVEYVQDMRIAYHFSWTLSKEENIWKI
jgi:hypothetical protein